MNTPNLKPLFAICAVGAAVLGAGQMSVLKHLPASPTLDVSTIPHNGDVNPYGVAYVPAGFPKGGKTQAGDILVSNFNNGANLQGTGTTIVRVTQTGQSSLFFQGSALGLTTALSVLKSGYVLVGNLSTFDGTAATVGQGMLTVLNKSGQVIGNLESDTMLDGPWDMTVNDEGIFAQVFISNVLSGSVTRIDLFLNGTFNILDMVTIASGYPHRSDPAALEVGPTGLAYDPVKDLLYVASTDDNRVYAVANAGSRFSTGGRGTVIYEDKLHLRGPLGLALTPYGDLIAANGDAVNANPNQVSELVEFTVTGHFVAQVSVDPSGAGRAFGLAMMKTQMGVQLAAVDDITNALKVWNVNITGPLP